MPPPHARIRRATLAAAVALLAAGPGVAQTTPLSPQTPAPATAGAPAAEVIAVAAQPLRPLPSRAGVVFGPDRGVRPVPPGFPAPSVIVGNPAAPPLPPEPETAPAPDLAVADPGTLAALEGEGFGTGIEDRLRLRAQDPALFASLMDSGAFDPAAGEVVAAIQAELARLGCYRGVVDGDWGAGSRAALARWVEAGGASGDTTPDAALFRRVAGGPDLRCPAPVAATPARQAPAAAAARQPAARQPQAQPATPRRAAPAAQPPRTAQPQPQRRQPAPQQPARRIDPNALGTGVFR